MFTDQSKIDDFFKRYNIGKKNVADIRAGIQPTNALRCMSCWSMFGPSMVSKITSNGDAVHCEVCGCKNFPRIIKA